MERYRHGEPRSRRDRLNDLSEECTELQENNAKDARTTKQKLVDCKIKPQTLVSNYLSSDSLRVCRCQLKVSFVDVTFR